MQENCGWEQLQQWGGREGKRLYFPLEMWQLLVLQEGLGSLQYRDAWKDGERIGHCCDWRKNPVL